MQGNFLLAWRNPKCLLKETILWTVARIRIKYRKLGRCGMVGTLEQSQQKRRRFTCFFKVKTMTIPLFVMCCSCNIYEVPTEDFVGKALFYFYVSWKWILIEVGISWLHTAVSSCLATLVRHPMVSANVLQWDCSSISRLLPW